MIWYRLKKENSSATAQEAKFSTKQKVFRLILRKQFSNIVKNENGENELVWDLEKAEELYKENLPDDANCCVELINIIKNSRIFLSRTR